MTTRFTSLVLRKRRAIAIITFLIVSFLALPVFLPLAAQRAHIDSLRAFIAGSSDERAKVDALTHLAYLLYRTAPEETQSYAEQALTIAQEMPYARGLAQANNVLGIYYWSRGQYQEALRHQLQALKGFEDLEDSSNVANISLNIGAIYNSLGNYEKALEHFLFSARFYETLNDRMAMAQAYNNIAVIIKNQGDYARALEYYSQSMALFDEYADSTHLAMSLYNIGAVHLLQKNYNDALSYFGRALELEKRVDDLDGMANTYLSIGNVHLERESFAEALTYFSESLQLMRELEDRGGTAICLQNIGMLHMQMGQYASAKPYLIEGLDIAQEIGARNTEKATLLALSNLEEMRGDFESSLLYFRTYASLKDSIFNTERSELIAEMQTKYETERMEQEIRLLMLDQEEKAAELIKKQKTLTRHQMLLMLIGILLVVTLVLSGLLLKQNRQKIRANRQLADQNKLMKEQRDELGRQRDTLRKLIATKDRFFAIIAHDLRNPFTALISITKSLSELFHEISEADKQTYIETVNEAAGRVYKLLENLLEWARSQTGDIEFRCERIPLRDSVIRCIEVLEQNATKKGINTVIEIEEGTVVHADRNMLETVIRNLVDNAIKFTDENGLVTLSAHPSNDMIEFSVTDNGMGISEEDISGIFCIEAEHKHIGHSREKGTGLGLILCKEFVEMNGGSIWVESTLGQGSTFSFTLRTKPPCKAESSAPDRTDG